MNLEALHKAVRDERIDWRKHSLSRLAERGITQRQALDVLWCILLQCTSRRLSILSQIFAHGEKHENNK